MEAKPRHCRIMQLAEQPRVYREKGCFRSGESYGQVNEKI